VQGVGYPNPNRSHFRSMDIWHSAAPEKEIVTSGWIGRYFDNTCPGCDPHVGVSIGEQMPLAMKGERIIPLSFDRPETYRYNGRDKDDYFKLNKIDPGAAQSSDTKSFAFTNAGTNAPAPVKPQAGSKANKAINPSDQLDFLHRTAMDAQLSSDDILRMTSRHTTPAA